MKQFMADLSNNEPVSFFTVLVKCSTLKFVSL